MEKFIDKQREKKRIRRLKKMKPRISDSDLLYFYGLLSVPMIDFDCGRYCGRRNNGTPVCCDPDIAVPVLYRDEYNYHRRRSTFWRRMANRTDPQRRLWETVDRHNILCRCPGVDQCDRAERALVCRTFPFEPYLTNAGEWLGLVFQYTHREQCYLIGQPRRLFSEEYLRNSKTFWLAIFERLPSEREVYIAASQTLRRRFGQKRKKVPYFTV